MTSSDDQPEGSQPGPAPGTGDGHPPDDGKGAGDGRPPEQAAGDDPGDGDDAAARPRARRDAGAAGPRPAGDERTSLAPLQGGGHLPPRPPRRTGVFVDPEELRSHVGDLLRTILGGYEVDAFGNFTFTHEGARAFVTVGPSPIGPQVGVFSVTNLDVELTPPLASFLLTTNHTLGFGAFSYDAQNQAVWLRHTLHGASLDLPELQSAVAAVATTAAALDDTIRDRFGGRTFQEAPDEVQRKVEPPDTSQPGPPPNASGYL